MSHGAFRDMILLARELQASSVGLTIGEMMERTGHSRRKLERMLSGMVGIGLHSEAGKLDGDHHRTIRWTLEDGLPKAMNELSGIERSTLETLLENHTNVMEREALAKLLAAQRPAGIMASLDQETIIERTAHLGRVGPSASISETLMRQLEIAVKGFEVLNITYHTPGTRKPIPRQVKPLGFVFGRFGYLVALLNGRDIRTYRLNLIMGAEQTGEYFERPTWFDLKAWASESFGIYHGDELKTFVVRFAPKVADRAESVRFHKSEKKERLADGSLRLTLRCRGHQELMWELSHPDWQGHITIT
jgi:predicted DNA-binding transcriptional regulator YafY